jgi:histidine ammonia-lyase
LILQSKEGLALINGTQFMNALALDAVIRGLKAYNYATRIASISIDAYDSSLQPFYEGIHTIRKHSGQIQAAQDIINLMEDSILAREPKQAVQDPYSFRCIPQVHGASLEAITHAQHTFLHELNAVTDNPLIFPDQDIIVSGGNFHGQVLALQMDFLKIALAELANISERRTYLLISGQRGLPPFLAHHAGLESGLMIAQYTAAAIVSANKQLCTPASVDSIVSSNGQEDHVSMGANAAVQLQQVIDNVESVLAIELMTATIGMRFRDADKTSSANKQLINLAESVIHKGKIDALTRNDMIACKQIITDDSLSS